MERRRGGGSLARGDKGRAAPLVIFCSPAAIRKLYGCLKISKFCLFFPIKLRKRVEKYPQAIIKCPRRTEMQSEGNAMRVLNRFNAIAGV